jgi:hypothetical protein
LKSSGEKVSPRFRPFWVEKLSEKNFCLHIFSYTFHWNIFSSALLVSLVAQTQTMRILYNSCLRQASCIVGAGRCFTRRIGVKAVKLTTHLHLLPRLRMVEFNLHSIRLHNLEFD